MGRPKKEYKCEKCGYVASQKSHYLKHLNRKKSCCVKETNSDNNDFKCEYCDLTFTFKNSIYNHLKICQVKKRVDICIKIEKINYENKLKQSNYEKLKYEVENKELKNKLEEERISKNELITIITQQLKGNLNKLITNKTFIIKLNKLLINEVKELRKSVEKHKTMNKTWGYSKVQLEWLKLKSIVDNTFIISKDNSEKEHSIDYLKDNKKNKKTRVDGFSRKLNKIYSFQGDYWHGNQKIYKPEDYNKTCKKTFGELYKKTVNRTKLLEKDYVVEEMWENDWKLYKKLLKEIKLLKI